MGIFGDEDNMVERFVEIDARVFLEGTAHVASGFSVNRPRYSGFSSVLVAVPSAYTGPYSDQCLFSSVQRQAPQKSDFFSSELAHNMYV